MHATNAGDPTRTNRHAKTKAASNPEGQRTDKTIRPIKGRGDSGNPSASVGWLTLERRCFSREEAETKRERTEVSKEKEASCCEGEGGGDEDQPKRVKQA